MTDHPLPYPINRIVASLRNIANQPDRIGAPTCDTIKMAADEIVRLTAEVERLRQYEPASHPSELED